MRVPRAWLRHRILAEPHLRAGGTGPLYGPARTVRCHLSPSTVLIAEDGDGDRVRRDATTIICALTDADVVNAQARLTVHGRPARVVSVKRHDYPGGGTPDHLEVVVI